MQNPRPPGPPRNPDLRKLVQSKQEWHYHPNMEAARLGFLGWHERGYLPHFDAPNVTQFVTFMLCDAFPVTRRREWEPILREADESLRRHKLEAWLDRGHGECWLRQCEVARRVEEILRGDNGQTYRLQAWAVMSNHVHLVVDVWETPLSKLLNLWKGRSSHDANNLLKRRGRFWEKESFDTLIRDAAHLGRAIHYTENNPVKAGLIRDPKQWAWSRPAGGMSVAACRGSAIPGAKSNRNAAFRLQTPTPQSVVGKRTRGDGARLGSVNAAFLCRTERKAIGTQPSGSRANPGILVRKRRGTRARLGSVNAAFLRRRR